MRGKSGKVALVLTLALSAGAVGAASATSAASPTPAAGCPHWGRPAVAADPRPHALRVFAIQFEQHPDQIDSIAAYRHAIDCALRDEVLPYRARGRPNLVVFDEDIGLETLAIGPRGRAARTLLHRGVPGCHGVSLCPTLKTISALNTGYGPALAYLKPRYPQLAGEAGEVFVAATDEFVRAFMDTMSSEARLHHLYIVASNTMAPFRATRDPAAVAALADPGSPRPRSVFAPTQGVAYDQTFVWGPQVVHRRAGAPLANLLADNYKVPLTAFEQTLGFAPGPSRGGAARTNLRPVAIPGTGARIGLATSLPAFAYGNVARRHACDDVAVSYMRCLDRLGANVLIQADANDGPWTGADGSSQESWQPLAWMGSAYRAVSDRSVHFAYAVNPFMVGNLADIPFDGQSAILQRGRVGAGCHYVGDRRAARRDLPQFRAYAGEKPQFLAIAPWVVADGPRRALRNAGTALGYGGSAADRYVQTAVIADLPFPADPVRPGCQVAGR